MNEIQPDYQMPTPIRVVIIDRQTLVRSGLRLIIESQAGFQVLGDAGQLDEAFHLVKQTSPDIILLEPNLRGELDANLVSSFQACCKSSKVIVVTDNRDPHFYFQCVQGGARGIVSKEQRGEMLLKAIEKVHAGEAWIDRYTMANVLEKFRTKSQNSNEVTTGHPGIEHLSQREREIIHLVCQGLKGKQIASQLNISEVTVRHHLTSIYNKLGVADRVELVIFAFQKGLADL